MTRSRSKVYKGWVCQGIYVSDPDIKSPAALVLLSKKYFGLDKSIYSNTRMLKVRRKWIKKMMENPDELGGLTCSICHKKGLPPFDRSNNKNCATLDHVIDIADGGVWNDPNNFQILCDRCNNRKSNVKLVESDKLTTNNN